MLSLIIALIPIVLILKYVYSKDWIEKESKTLLIVLFVGGTLSVALTKIFGNIIVSYIPEIEQEQLNSNIYVQILISFVKISFVEEISKWIILNIITWKNKNFNYMYDAIVYSVFISLGFALCENFNYLIYSSDEINVLRSFISVPMHAVFGVYMGYYIGNAKYAKLKKQNSNWGYYIFLSFFIPMLIHGLNDFLLLRGTRIFIIIYIIFMIVIYISAIKKIKEANMSTLEFNNK